MSLRVVLACLMLIAACNWSSAYTMRPYIEAHEMESNKLTYTEQLPPVDPALHPFPTKPTVPLMPVCMREGYFRDPYNCRKFYSCSHPSAVPIAFYCQAGLIFDTVGNICTHPNYVDC